MAAASSQGRISILDEELDALLAAQEQEHFLASSASDDSGMGGVSDSDSDSDSADGGGGRLPWALRNVPVLVSWTSLAAVFALQPPGRRIPPTLDLIVTTVRASYAPCAPAHAWTHALRARAATAPPRVVTGRCLTRAGARHTRRLLLRWSTTCWSSRSWRSC